MEMIQILNKSPRKTKDIYIMNQALQDANSCTHSASVSHARAESCVFF